MASTEPEHREDEDTGAQVAPIVKLDGVSVTTGEEDEDPIFDLKAKLYRFHKEGNQWKERGAGNVKLLKHKENGKIRLVMRQSKTLKICANHLVQATTTVQEHAGNDKSCLWHASDFADGELKNELFCIRFPSVENCKTFMTTMQEVTESQGREEENKDASDTAVLLEKLTVGDNKTKEKEQEKVTVTDKEDKQAVVMSSDDRTSAVMKALRSGAYDYLIKPVHQEVLRNIWKHAWRRKLNENKEHENSGCLEDNYRNQYTSLLDPREVIVKPPMKRSSSKEDEDGELVNDDPPASKKPRVVWSVESHQQFVSAVKELGLDKAVPKRIHELMNIPGLTKENVASHLQKYKLYLKRQVSEEDHHQQNGMSNTIGYVESKLGGLGRVDIEALAAAGQVSPQTLGVQTLEHASLFHASIQHPKNFPHSILTIDDAPSGLGAWPHSNTIGSVGPNGNLGEIGVRNKNILLNILHQQRLHQQKQQQQQLLIHNQSHSLNTVQPSCLLVPSQSTGTFQAGLGVQTVEHASLHASIHHPKNFPHSILTVDDAPSGLGAWSHSNAIGSVGPNGNLGEIGVRNKNILLNILHQHRLHQQKQQQQQLLIHNQSHSLNTVQPSCLLVPSQFTGTFQAGNSSASVNHSSNFGRTNVPIDSSSLFAPQSYNSSSSISRCAGGNGYRSLGTISPSTSLPSCSIQQLHNSTLTYCSARPLQSLAPNESDTQGPYGTKSGDALEQAAVKNLGFVCKGTCISSSFSALEIESSINDLSDGQISVDSNDCKTFMTTMQEVVESQGRDEENKDASDTAVLLEKLTVGDNKSEEQEKVTVTDKEDKQAVGEHEKPGVDKKDEPAPQA